jgi:tetratricopeptide (TPR) repeat protein
MPVGGSARRSNSLDFKRLSSQQSSSPALGPFAAQELERARGLARTGRAAEAEQAYRGILSREPACAPAAVALSRLLIAMGRAAEAEAAARPFAQGAAPWPEALSARAAALKLLERREESLADYRRAAELNPQSGVAAHNVASGLGDAGRDREAAAECERAFALGLDAPETWLVYGRALQSQRRYDEAERALAAAVARRPAYADAVRDLSQLIWMRRGDAAQALAPVDAALAGVAGSAAATAPLAAVKIRLLNHIEGPDTARVYAEEALAASGGDPRLALETAQLLLETDPARGLDLASAVARRAPQEPAAQRVAAHAHLALGDGPAAAAISEQLLARDPTDQEAAAALATAWRLAGDARYRDLWDYAALVRAQSIDTPRGWSGLGAYLDDLQSALSELHALSAHPIEQSLRGGTQTPQNLLHSDHPAIAAFFQAIEGPIQAYRAAVGQGEDVFRRRNRGAHRVLGAWSVRLRPKGFHVDHIHPQGWISSACYIGLPAAIGDEQDRAGWLRFGAPPIPTKPILEAEHYVRPEPGLLALFPSYMWHGTVPFGGDEPRLTIAFDVTPAH